MKQLFRSIFCSLFHKSAYRFWWTDSDYFQSCDKCKYCEKIAILILLFGALSANADPVLTPVFRPASNHLGVAAYWMQPVNEIWISEWSTNLVTWQRTGNETSYSTGLCYTETGLGWTHQIFFRLRRLQ